MTLYESSLVQESPSEFGFAVAGEGHQQATSVAVERQFRSTAIRDCWTLDLPSLQHGCWCIRKMAQMTAYAIALVFEVAMRMNGGRRRRIRPRRSNGNLKHVLLTGTFHADAWLEAHVRPIADAPACGRVTVVADKPMIPIHKVRYRCPPMWLQSVVGRALSRSILYLLVALTDPPDVCGGFHLLCNGLLALVTASLIEARSLYFSVGGRTEIIGGGAFGENRALWQDRVL